MPQVEDELRFSPHLISARSARGSGGGRLSATQRTQQLSNTRNLDGNETGREGLLSTPFDWGELSLSCSARRPVPRQFRLLACSLLGHVPVMLGCLLCLGQRHAGPAV